MRSKHSLQRPPKRPMRPKARWTSWRRTCRRRAGVRFNAAARGCTLQPRLRFKRAHRTGILPFFSLSRSSLVLFVSANKELTQQYQELKAENLKQQKEAKTLQEELDKQVDKAAEASAAATTMEIEVQKLLAELEEQGVQHSNALSQATAEMKTLLDEQSAEAVSAKEQYEKVQAEKRRLRDEMDKQIAEAAMKAAEAQAMTDKVISELAQAKAQNDEYQRAIREIAALAATMTKTNEPTSLG